jgi:hypothetical protein
MREESCDGAMTVAMSEHKIWRIADDKIVEHWGSRDDLGLLAQLGLLPVGEEPKAG